MSDDSTGRLQGWRSTARRAVTIVGTLVLVAVVVPFVVFAVPQVVGADHGFVILSGSMEPAISPGDVVIVDDSDGVDVGDVITFQDGTDVPTTHRVIDEVDGEYVTQGDANENPDAHPVSPDDVLGRVVFTIPLIGHVILWVNTPTGYVTLVLGPLFLLAGTELVSWARRRGSSADSAPKPAIRRLDSSPTPAIRRVGADHETAETATDAEPEATGTVAVAVADLKLSVLALGGLFAYAAWNVYREVTALAAPNPISVGALTAGLVGMVFAGWVTASAWYGARRRAGSSATDSPEAARRATRTDGGTDREGDR